MDPESFEDLGDDKNVFENLPKISDDDVQEAMKQQGVGKVHCRGDRAIKKLSGHPLLAGQGDSM